MKSLTLIYLVFIYKTQYGLRLSSCGENPSSADSLGINVKKTRYIGVLTSGIFAGLGDIKFTSQTFIKIRDAFII